MAVALILPFTFALDPMTSIAILLGVYVSAYYGGAVTAIMIATPGTPNAAATVLDGYPLCRQGYARKALQMSLYASVTGGTVGVLVAMSVFPLVAQLVLRFGPPEMFALLVFSITVIAGVSGASLIKGFLAATAGFLLSSIGRDPIFGSSRFVFGIPEIMGGLHILPILIGLFSFPEIVMRAAESGGRSGSGISYIEMGPRLRFAEYLANWRIYLRSAAAGSMLGALPGLGGSPAAFLGYFLAQRFSRHPERFGHGSMEGLSSCEAANSSVAGAAMVPMMSLGIPGGATTAVIMGALIIHGMTAGPTLFVTEPEFVYSTFLVLILCLMIMLVGLGMIRVANLIVRIPTQILFPMVLIFATFGSYAIRNNISDVIAMYLIGIAGAAGDPGARRRAGPPRHETGRVDAFPDVPTFAELGHADVDTLAWRGIIGPRDMPEEVIEVWDGVIRRSSAMKNGSKSSRDAGTSPSTWDPRSSPSSSTASFSASAS